MGRTVVIMFPEVRRSRVRRDEPMSDLVLIATLLTAAAALGTVLELRSQRNLASLPDPCIPSAGLRIMMLRDHRLEVFNEGGPPTEMSARARIQLQNIGVGAAKDVSYRWEFDVLEFIRIVTEFDSDKELKILWEDDLLRVKGQPGGVASIHSNLFTESEAPNVMPANVETTPVFIGLPTSYFGLLCCLIHVMPETEEEGLPEVFRFFKDESVPLALHLTYRDIQGKHHHKKFAFTLSIRSLRTGTPSLADDTIAEKVAELHLRARQVG